MPIQRQTARKVRILDLMKGEWVRKEGMEPSYVQTRSGERVSRARVLGTVVGKFQAEDGNFASITLDDGTDTIRAKTFKTVKPLDSVNVGELVEMIGKVREWNDEVYILPELVRRVTDPNFELLRRLELLRLSKSEPKTQGQQQPEGPNEQEKLRNSILKVIEGAKDGISYAEILEKLKVSEEKAEPVINELLAEGICYEPSPGKVKKI